MDKKIIDFWALNSEPRESQIQTFEWLEKQTAKYIFLELPVGGGKSAIGLTYAGYLSQSRGYSYILTPQRILQEQYENSFRKELLFSLYGKSNYSCEMKKTDCGLGSQTRPACENCAYKSALASARSSANLVMNYKLALLHFAFLPLFNKRKLMVLDECHSLEKELVEFDSLEITKKRCKKYGLDYVQFKDINDAYDWVHDGYEERILDIFDTLQDKVAGLLNSTSLNPDQIELIKEFESMERYIKTISMFLSHSLEEVKEKYVLVHDKGTFFEFKKLYAKDQFNRILKPKAEQFLFMSATILDHKGFCRDMGINPDESAFLSIPSEFPAENRPVFYMPTLKMNSKWKDDEHKKLRKIHLDKIVGLCEMHKMDSGIIHTGNFEVARWLVEELKDKIPQKIFHHIPSDYEKTDRNTAINSFIEYRKPAVLISPSITEGLDLKHDLSRFAIFSKIPFGYLGDQWIKARMDLSKEWYQRMALIDVLQGCGRVVRSKEDWGNVYILDSSWSFLLSQMGNKIPEWWFDAYCKYEED